MKNLLLILFILSNLTSFSQDNYLREKEISGVVLDSNSSDPIPFATITINQKLNIKANIEGNFLFTITEDSIFVLSVSAVGYKKQTLIVPFDSTFITIKLKQVPLNTRIDSIIWGKISDTTYYFNGKIKSIKHYGRYEIGFYKSGQKKYQFQQDEYRQWYKNGNLKYLAIIKFNHHRIETKWYENGLIKEHGTRSWGFKKNRRSGGWYKNNDWKYWDRHGKEKNYR